MFFADMPEWNPEDYWRWFRTPLGQMVDADEKAVLFGLAAIQGGERVLDVGCGEGKLHRACGQDAVVGADSRKIAAKARISVFPLRYRFRLERFCTFPQAAQQT
jgi:hypothetical protein